MARISTGMLARPVALTGLLLLAACQPPPPAATPVPGLPDVSGTCGAAALQSLVGQSARVLAAMKFAASTRIIRPGDGVTMDYSPDRVNIEIDLHETIAAVRCG